MNTSSAIRQRIEDSLARRIPGALTPRPRQFRELTPTGIAEIDALLQGGMPLGAISELVGPNGSGRTTLALSVLAGLTAAGKAVAWVDAADALDPASAATAGVDLSRQLWVRCGAHPVGAPVRSAPAHGGQGAALLVEGSRTPAPSGGGGSPHPRGEARGLSAAVDAFLQQSDVFARQRTQLGVDNHRANLRRNRQIGTPGAPNRKLPGASAPFPHRSADREEQIPSDRQPSRRQRAFAQPERPPRNLSSAQIAFTGQVAGAWDDNRNNRNGRALQTAPNDIAAGLPRFREMEARASGQGHGLPRGPFEWKPSLAGLHAQPGHAAQPGDAAQPGHAARQKAPGAAAAQATPPRQGQASRTSLAGERPPRLSRAQSPVWKTLDQALRSTDLLLSAGGFSALVLDLGGIAPDFTWRIPLATWFRFRSAAERSRTSLLLLTQHASARSAAELVLCLDPATPQATGTVLTGAKFHIGINRQRFEAQLPEPEAHSLHLVPRKPPQTERGTHWQRQAAWAGSGTP